MRVGPTKKAQIEWLFRYADMLKKYLFGRHFKRTDLPNGSKDFGKLVVNPKKVFVPIL